MAISTTYEATAAVPTADRDVVRGRLLLTLAIGYPLCAAPQLGGGSVDLDSAANLDAAASNMVNQAFWVVLFTANLFAMRPAGVARLAGRLWPMPALLIWAAVSTAWALAPEIVARRVLLQVFVVASIVIPVALIADEGKIRETVMRVMVAVVVMNLVALALRPPTPLGHAGIYSHKNELGAMAGLVFISCVTLGRTGSGLLRWLAWGGAPCALLLIAASRSKTSLLLALLAPALGWGIAALARMLRLSPLVLVLCALAVFVPLILLVSEATSLTFDDLLKLAFGDTSFTGRTEIWAFAWDQIQQRPWLGVGFNGFWGIGEKSPALLAHGYLIPYILQAHNGYLDILLETGFVGLALFLYLVAMTFVGSRRVLTHSVAGGAFVISLVLFCLFHNLLESTALRRFHPLWVFMLLAAATTAATELRDRGRQRGAAA